MNLPKIEINTFDGSPRKYHTFLAVFNECVDSVISDPQIKLTRLLQYTKGRAHEAIESCALIGGEEGYTKARQILHNRFGDEFIVSSNVISDLKRARHVRSNEDLRKYVDDIQSSVMLLKTLKLYQEIDNQEMQNNILRNIPTPLRDK